MKLKEIQTRLKAPKNQFNKFGNYKYRNQEDILEAVKPLLDEYNCTLTLTDEVKEIGSIIYLEATATFTDIENNVITQVKAHAGIDIHKKGMSIEQCFGSASSYARKYCLNGLLLCDDTKDPDSQDNTKNNIDEVGIENRDYLHHLLENSTYDERVRVQLRYKIDNLKTLDDFETAKINLLGNQLGIDGAVNPGANEIKRHIKKISNG